MTTEQATPLPSATLIKRLLSLSYDLFILVALSMAYSALATVLMANVIGSGAEDEYLPMQQGYWFQAGWVGSIVAFYWFCFVLKRLIN